MSLLKEDLERFFNEQWAWLQQAIETLVKIESPSSDFSRLDRVASLIEAELARIGAEIISCTDSPRAVRARFGKGLPKTALVFHHDTVWPVGSFGEMRVDRGKWYGPGIFDMKANIPLVLLSLKYLGEYHKELLEGILWASSPDEETLGPVSTQVLTEFLNACPRALVFEPPLAKGHLKQNRKGCVRLRVDFTGRQSHTGNHYAEGKSALAAAARFLLFAEGLTDLKNGHTINIGMLTGGSAANTRPGSAEMIIDVRMLDLKAWEHSRRALYGYRDEESVQVNIEEIAYLPPMRANHEDWRILETVCGEAECPFGLGSAGGGSDGSRLASMGVKVMDGLGVPGAGEHAENEHIEMAWLKPIFVRNTLLLARFNR